MIYKSYTASVTSLPVFCRLPSLIRYPVFLFILLGFPDENRAKEPMYSYILYVYFFVILFHLTVYCGVYSYLPITVNLLIECENVCTHAF